MPKARIAIALAVVLAAVLSVARPSSGGQHRSTTPQPKRQLQSVQRYQLDELRQGVRFYRSATWHWQDMTGLRRTPTSYAERHVKGKGFLRWSVHMWHKRALKARHYAHSIFHNHGYLPPDKARLLGRYLAAKQGWTGVQWDCLNRLWGTYGNQTLESGWSVTADNPTSEAHGIPQANPGSKMAEFGRNWWSSAYVQIRWGLHYIKTNLNFHTPCEVLNYRLANGSY